jgi:hypothetical protein
MLGGLRREEGKAKAMYKNKFQQLRAIKEGHFLEFAQDSASCVLCPDVAGRIFAEIGGLSVHRIDLDCVAKPDRPFNNYGGGNFWPAPEGGRFGFNHRGSEWYVQECINKQPFEVVSHDAESAVISKRIVLINRAGTSVESIMKRVLTLPRSLPPFLNGKRLRAFLTYQTTDTFEVLNSVAPDKALIGAWTLEQFDTSESTVAFCPVENPSSAINFDFYEHPKDRITYFKHGFGYKMDGRCKEQIGIKKAAAAPFIGFHDASRQLLCTRENRSGESVYFNMADNDQPNGPYSAADNYSIFNSDPDMQAFELETVSGARIQDGLVKGSELVSVTTFAKFENPRDLQDFVDQHLGG